MLKFRLVLTFCIVFLSIRAFTQGLQDFEYLGEKYGDRELYLGLYPTYTTIRNKVAPNSENHAVNAWSGEITLRKVNFEQGGLRWNWQQKMFVDVFLLLGEALQEDPNVIFRSEETAISCGIIGWLDFTVNLNEPTGKWLYSLGINHNDYFYATTYAHDSISGSGWASYDPQGHFLAVGPSFIVNYLPTEFLMAELSTSYSISYAKSVDLSYATNPDPNYPKPHWGQIDLELQTKWGFFTGFNYNWIINRGDIPSEGKRLDILTGFRFMI